MLPEEDLMLESDGRWDNLYKKQIVNEIEKKHVFLRNVREI
jgi:hypothetical protein